MCALKSLAGNPLAEELRRRGVSFSVVGSSGLRDVAAFRRLLARLRRDPPDVVHAHLTDATIWCAALARRLRRPLVVTLHVLPGTGAVAGWRGALRRRLERRALRRADALLAVSAAVRRAWLADGLPGERFEVVHNGIDTALFAGAAADATAREAMRRRLGVEEGEPLLLAVSVLRRRKGLRTLLAAFERLLAERPQARLAVVGDGPEGEALRGIAAPLGDRVVWAGYQAEVAPWLAAADLFVLPSRDDAFPTALLEAAAAGLPAVAAASGGVPEIVAVGETGLLVTAGRAEELAAAIGGLLADPARRATMGAAARRRAEERFSLATWSARLEDLYRRLAGEGLRIAVVEPAARGGLVHYAHQLCAALAEAGAAPTLVTARGSDELAALPTRPGAAYRRLELLRLWDPKPAAGTASRLPRPVRRAARSAAWYREWLRLLLWVARERPDVVQLGDVRFAGDLLPILVLSKLGPALVDVCHNVRPFALGGRRAGWFAAGRATRWLYRRIYRRFDRVVVHFAANRDAFLADTGLPPERVATTVLGNQEIFAELADPAVTPAVLRQRLGLPAEAPVVLLFGTMAPYKGIDLAIEAMARLRESRAGRPPAHLVVAGFPLPGFDLAAHRRRAEELGVAERVRFVPEYVPSGEVAAWMELAAVVVLPYRQIFQSGVLPAAQTFGRPVIVAAVGALPEAVEDGRTGLVVPPGDAGALAAALDRLLGDPELAARLGRAAAEAARERFAWRRVADDLLAVHRAAIAERRGRG